MRQKFQPAAFPAVFSAIMLAFFPPEAQAYLDPSTGSMVVTALVGVFASLALAVRTWWYKIRRLFRRSGRQTATAEKDSAAKD